MELEGENKENIAPIKAWSAKTVKTGYKVSGISKVYVHKHKPQVETVTPIQRSTNQSFKSTKPPLDKKPFFINSNKINKMDAVGDMGVIKRRPIR